MEMRYLLDTSIVVSALRSKRGASNALLKLAFQGRLRIVIHYKLLAEYRAVLSRREHFEKIGWPEERLRRFLAALVHLAEEVNVRYLLRPNLPDADDDFIYELAFAASPCTIVTHNVRDFKAVEVKWLGVTVRTPQQVLKEVARNA